MGLKKAYDELTDTPEFTDGLALSTGQSIEDESGTERIKFNSGATYVKDENGDNWVSANSGTATTFDALSNRPIRILDKEGSFTAVQYDTDPGAGVLRTPNAGIAIESSHLGNYGSELEFTTSTGGGKFSIGYDNNQLRFRDLTNSSEVLRLNFDGSGPFDLSGSAQNLRLATGQSIEDGSGTARLRLGSTHTRLNYDNGNLGISVNSGNHLQLTARSSEPVQIFDSEGNFDAVQYTTSTSAPSTLELKNVKLELYQTTSDPSASPGQLWYRSDLD